MTDNIADYQFIFYDNDTDEKAMKIIKAEPIPSDYKYIIKAPPPKIIQKGLFYGYGKPMNEFRKM